VIKAKGLKKRFGNFEALKGIDLNVEKGEIYGFLGHNGAGKSTTMNILTGLSKADAGSCMVNGWNLSMVDHPGDLHVGYLPEEPKFYPWMTGREVLEYLGAQWSRGSIQKRVDEMLDWVGLTQAGKRRVGGYSRGMKQRLGMAAALFYDSELILLDEPSSALDPEGRSDVLNMIRDLKDRGKTVFLSTHILSDAERVCDRVGILFRGRMVVEKSLQTLLAENVKSIYDILLFETLHDDSLKELGRLPGVKCVERDREKLSVEVDSPHISGNALLSYLSSTDAVVRSFELRRATLEDIFLEEVSKGEQ
jgi:ABC-2 type transport system ATP-binding protein